jgi:hypothetical protein
MMFPKGTVVVLGNCLQLEFVHIVEYKRATTLRARDWGPRASLTMPKSWRIRVDIICGAWSTIYIIVAFDGTALVGR